MSDRENRLKRLLQDDIYSLLEMNGDVGIAEIIENKKQSNINDNFKKWFGNSKTIKDGQPIVYYHRTNADFDEDENYGEDESFFVNIMNYIKDDFRMNKNEVIEDMEKLRQKYKQLMNIKESANNSTNKSIDKEINEVLKLAGVNLTEGIVDVAKYYPKLDIETIKSLINLDPTYNGGNELGKYGKWILNLYNKFIKDKLAYEKWEEQKKMGNNFPEPMRKSTDKQEDFEKIPNLLKQFNILNNKLKTNIDNIKSISDLYKVVNDAKASGISTNKKVQKGIDLFKKSVQKGGEVVFKNSNWVILVPETLESSVVFGDDTNWCTTTPNGEMYYYYLKEYGGKYFINLDLQTGDLYQFHFESNQFMNSNDKAVNIKEIIKDKSVIKLYLNYLYNNIKNDKEMNVTLLPIILKFDDNPSEEVQLMAVQQNGYSIRYIKNPSEKVQMEAVKADDKSIQYIKNPSEQVQLMAVQQDGNNIKYIKNPSEQVQMESVKQNGWSIQYIKNPSEKVQMEAVREHEWSIQFIKNPSEQLQLMAVKGDYRSIQYIKNPSEQLQLMAVKQDGKYIQYINNPTEKVQIMSIKEDDSYIRFIKNPSEQVQLMSVQQYGGNIIYIEAPSEQVKLMAVQQDGNNIKYIEAPSEQVQMEAVKQDGKYIRYIKNPSEQVQMEAVKQNGKYIRYIKNPTEKVKEYVHMKTNQSTNKSIDEEINEVLKLSGVK